MDRQTVESLTVMPLIEIFRFVYRLQQVVLKKDLKTYVSTNLPPPLSHAHAAHRMK